MQSDERLKERIHERALPVLEAASVRAAQRHAASARVGRGASTGSLPGDEEGGDGSVPSRDLGDRQIRGSAALSAAARAMTVESVDLRARRHAGECV